LQGALQWFDAALRLKPDPEYALVQAAALGDAGAPALGVRHLDEFERLDSIRSTEPVRNMFTLHAWLLRHNGYYHSQVMDLRRQLQADADSRAPLGDLR
jgi:protein O-mannosyl-transferase